MLNWKFNFKLLKERCLQLLELLNKSKFYPRLDSKTSHIKAILYSEYLNNFAVAFPVVDTVLQNVLK